MPVERTRHLVGSLLVVIAAISFGFMALFARWATDAGTGTAALLAIRFALAAIVYIALVLGNRAARSTLFALPRSLLLGLFALGALGYFGESMGYFLALHHIPAGLVALLLYTYPAIVTVLARLFLHERITRVKLFALLLALVGTALAIGPLAWGERTDIRGSLAAGVALGLTCSVSYALYIIFSSRLAPRAGSLVSSALVCIGATFSLTLAALVRADAWPSNQTAWLGAGLLGLLCTVAAVYCFLAGLERIGPVRASTLSSIEPAVTVGVGVLLMGERFSPLQLAGGAFILAAAVITAHRARTDTGATNERG